MRIISSVNVYVQENMEKLITSLSPSNNQVKDKIERGNFLHTILMKNVKVSRISKKQYVRII